MEDKFLTDIAEYYKEQLGEGWIILQLECKNENCPIKVAMPALVKETDYEDWQNGKFIQDAMPYLSPDHRELLISDLCPVCFDEITKEKWGSDPWLPGCDTQ